MTERRSDSLSATPPVLWLLFAAAFFTVLGVGNFISLFLPGNHRADLPTFFNLIAFALFCALPCGVAMAAMVSAWERIVVDESGIRWRNRRGWHQAVWDDITDFYARSTTDFVIVTQQGEKIGFDRTWRRKSELQELLVQRLGETLDLRDWALQGTRLRDLPQTFLYNARKIRRGCFSICTFFGAITLLYGALLYWGMPKPELALFAILLPFPLMAAGITWQALRGLRERCGEEFVAQADGFVFDDGRESVFVPWDRIIGYDFNPTGAIGWRALTQSRPPQRLRTEQGQEFTFTLQLEQMALWQAIVRRYAVHGIESKIDWERRDARGGVEHCWSGGIEAVGDRIFHSRTNSNRSWMRIALLFLVLPATFLTLDALQLSDVPLTGSLVTLAGVIAFEAIMAWRYYNERVQIGASGITCVSLRGRRSLAWGDIESWRQDGGAIRVVGRDGTSFYFRPSGLAYGSQIAPLIEAYCRGAQATYTPERALSKNLTSDL